jgi:hypothetical protein
MGLLVSGKGVWLAEGKLIYRVLRNREDDFNA